MNRTEYWVASVNRLARQAKVSKTSEVMLLFRVCYRTEFYAYPAEKLLENGQMTWRSNLQPSQCVFQS